ncbi:hypothetical protein CFC21_009800 [Triticum aestivum]|uniref:Uncharacterized protein n=2 Tax=Triticum aestivum TaxID=4565 RepID=A0A9R1DJA8_WHEAT|nr:uncharacterized protein LOC123162406 [Triticum aestivum]KAF6992844.1 hypothetical protein CFC21_009800 [Triticum aestivum]
MSMEPSSWVVPCYSGWSMEEAALWNSEDRISFQTSLPSHSDSVQLQMVEYAAPATPTPTQDNDCSDPTIQVFKEVVQSFHTDYLDSMERKMHKIPPSLIGVGTWYIQPVTVAIGPYHHGLRPGLLEAERVKHVAATQCITDSGRPVQEMYDAVFAVSADAHSLYYPDELARFRDDDFLPMMFLDGCFLVQFMRCYGDDVDGMDEALNRYFCANYERIYTDIMMLENQIPWVVVQNILKFMPEPSLWEDFVAAMRAGMKNQMNSKKVPPIDVVPTYEPPHLLGLVRFYIVGNNDDIKVDRPTAPGGDKPMSLSISVAELADVGITIVPETEKTGLVHMTLEKKRLVHRRLGGKKFGFLFGDLRVPPLFPTDANATWLVNMAAFELCKTPDFEGADVKDEDSAVCSYLHLFAMLLDQDEHVHDLRKTKVIEGGGLTSKEMLELFTGIGKNMRLGKCYLDIIIEIEKFKQRRSIWLKLYLFFIKHWTKIMAVVTVLGAVIGILSSLQALKPS